MPARHQRLVAIKSAHIAASQSALDERRKIVVFDVLYAVRACDRVAKQTICVGTGRVKWHDAVSSHQNSAFEFVEKLGLIKPRLADVTL